MLDAFLLFVEKAKQQLEIQNQRPDVSCEKEFFRRSYQKSEEQRDRFVG